MSKKAAPAVRELLAVIEEMGAKAAAEQSVRERYAVPVKPRER